MTRKEMETTRAEPIELCTYDMCTREKLANLCHEQWSGWMEYLFSKCFAEVGQFDKDTGNLIIPEWAVNRWRRQMRTPYAELPENDKESDRKEADRFLAILFSDGNQVAKNELAELRAELEKLKRQWAEDDRDITELEDENNQLRAELSAERDKWDYYQNFVKGHGADSITDLVVQRDKERKKREEAEADVYKLGQENIELEADLSATKKKCDEYREMANKVQIGGESFQLQFLVEEEDKCRGLEIQVEVLREALENIIDITGPGSGPHGVATRAIANLPTRAAAVRKVLDAADKAERGLKHRQYVESQYTDLDELFKRVHELRGTK